MYSISDVFVYVALFHTYQTYMKRLEKNLSFDCHSPEAFWWSTDEDLIKWQLNDGWPCGAFILS